MNRELFNPAFPDGFCYYCDKPIWYILDREKTLQLLPYGEHKDRHDCARKTLVNKGIMEATGEDPESYYRRYHGGKTYPYVEGRLSDKEMTRLKERVHEPMGNCMFCHTPVRIQVYDRDDSGPNVFRLLELGDKELHLCPTVRMLMETTSFRCTSCSYIIPPKKGVVYKNQPYCIKCNPKYVKDATTTIGVDKLCIDMVVKRLNHFSKHNINKILYNPHSVELLHKLVKQLPSCPEELEDSLVKSLFNDSEEV